jgi:hypothetical protein
MAYTWSQGDKITASRLNQINQATQDELDAFASTDANIQSQVDQNSENITKLYLENYYAGKVTPYDGLMFDGFSDTLKADIESQPLSANANSGQKVVVTSLASLFREGQEVIVRDSVGAEVNVIDTIVGTSVTMVNNLANNYTTANGAVVERTSADVNTANKELRLDGTTPQYLTQQYYTKRNAFQQKIAVAKMFVKRYMTGTVPTILPPSQTSALFVTRALGEGAKIPLANMQASLDSLGNTFYVEAWVRADDLNTGFVIYDDWTNNVAQAGWQVYISAYKVGSSHYSGGNYGYWATSGTPFSGGNNGQWVHVAVLMGNQSMDCWVNGVHYACAFTGGSATVSTINRTGIDNYIGTNALSYNNSLNGQICQLRIWNVDRSAYASYAWLQKISSGTGLVASWHLDGDYSDALGLGQTLVAVGSPSFQSVTYIGENAQGDERLLASSIAQSATSLTLADGVSRILVGDTVDIYDSLNQVRERKTVTGIPAITYPTPDADTASAFASYSASTGASHSMPSITVANNTNRLLVVFVEHNQTSVTAMTFNGVALTLANRTTVGGGTVETWTLKNPSVGTYPVLFTTNLAVGRVGASCGVYYNVNQTTPYSLLATGGTASNVSTYSMNITPTEQYGRILSFCFPYNSGSSALAVANALTTKRTSVSPGTWQAGLGDSNVPVTYGQKTATWNWSGACRVDMVVLQLHPSALIIPDYDIDFTPAIANAGGFATGSRVSRVSVLPKISITGTADDENLVAPTYVRSMRGTETGGEYTEDEYEYTPVAPNYDVVVKLEVSRPVLSETTKGKSYGVTLISE